VKLTKLNLMSGPHKTIGFKGGCIRKGKLQGHGKLGALKKIIQLWTTQAPNPQKFPHQGGMHIDKSKI